MVIHSCCGRVELTCIVSRLLQQQISRCSEACQWLVSFELLLVFLTVDTVVAQDSVVAKSTMYAIMLIITHQGISQ